MTNQHLFYQAIQESNINEVIVFLNNPKINPSESENQAICEAAEIGDLAIFKLLLEDKRVDPSDFDNQALILSSKNGHYDIVLLLLKDKRVNPCCVLNAPIVFAFRHKHKNVVQLLWKENSIKETLKQNSLKTYNELIREDTKFKIHNF